MFNPRSLFSGFLGFRRCSVPNLHLSLFVVRASRVSLMLRHFVLPAGLLGVLGFVGLSQPTSPVMAVPKLEDGEGDGADNRLGFAMYQMKMSSEGLRRGTTRSRPSWLLLQSNGEVLAEAESPSMAEEESRGGEGDNVERLRRKVIRSVREYLDKLKALNEKLEARMYKMKSRSLGSPEGWRSYEDALGRRREIIHTLRGYLDELQGLDHSFEDVIKKQMKTSTGSSYYRHLAQRKMELRQQQSVCFDNLKRMLHEEKRVFQETEIQMNEVLFGISMIEESNLL